MKRVEIIYGGGTYTIPGRDTQDVLDEIGRAIGSGEHHWLKVNSGEGVYEGAFLLIAPGIPISVIDVMTVDDETTTESSNGV